MMNSAAARPSSVSFSAGAVPTSPSPSWPCTKSAYPLDGFTIARAAPRATGTWWMPKRSRSDSALRVVVSTEALPNTVVMPTSSARGSRASMNSAIASSMPGSVSNRILVVMAEGLRVRRRA